MVKPVVLAITMVLLTATARAEDRDAAVLHYNAAVQRIEAGDYPGAIREFQDAYLAAPSPSFLYNIAQAYARIGEKGDAEANRLAVQNYRRYLREYQEAKGVAPPNQTEVERAIEQLQAPRGEQPAKAAPPAKPNVEEKPPVGEHIGETEVPTLKPVEAPAVENAPVQPPIAQPEDKGAEQAPGAAMSPAVGRPAVTAKVTPIIESSPSSRRRRIAGWGLAIGGVAVAVAGAVLVGLAAQHAAAATDATATPRLSDYYGERSTAGTDMIIGGVALGVGAAALIAGVVTLATGRNARPMTALYVVPSTNSLAVAGSF